MKKAFLLFFTIFFIDNFCIKINICILLNNLRSLCIQEISRNIYICFCTFHIFLSLCSHLHLILWIPSEWLLTGFENELAINLVLSINCTLHDIFFANLFTFLSLLLTFFLLKTSSSTEQVNCFSNSFAYPLMIKW